MNSPLPRLLLITDEGLARGAGRSAIDAVADAVGAGARFVQLREKSASALEAWRTGREVAALVAAVNGFMVVNDRADLALGLAADGVHRPSMGLPVDVLRRLLLDTNLIGVSAHDLDEALQAEDDGADYITLSPVFPSASKPGYGPALGLEGLAAIAARIDTPIFALGGIRPDNVRACLDHGAYGVAVMGGIMAATDPFLATRAYLDALTPG
jgi:thiamine-phosphate pyrophosphorylase